MDPNVLHLIIAAALTVLGVVITALIWKSAQVKTVFWWIGMTMIPMAVYLAGLGPAVVGAITTMRLWWGTLTFTPIVWVALVMGGLGSLLVVGSRLIPSESRADRKALKASTSGKTANEGGRPAPKAAAPRSAAITAPGQQPGRPTAPTADSDFDEIADLLRKRGIN